MPSSADMVEALLDADDPVAATLAALAEDAEVRPLGEEQTLHGLPAIKRYAESSGREVPTIRSLLLYEVGDDALVLTEMAVTRRRPKRYSEVVSAGYVVTARDGSIVRICSYPSWREAREAVGLSSGELEALTPRRRQLRGVLMSLREAVRAAGRLRRYSPRTA